MTQLVRRRSIPIAVMLVLVIGGGLFWWSSRDHGAAADRAVYIGLGASDTVGVGAAQPSTDGWVPLVAGGLPGHPDLVNLGISGATLEDVVSQELPVALDAQPAWVSIWPGVNDLRHNVSLETFSKELTAILDQIDRQTSARIIVLNIPDLRAVPAFQSFDPNALDHVVRQWNATIASAAKAHDAILVDLYGNSAVVTGHPEDVSGDGFHPSSAGYKRIADLVLKTVHQHDSPAAP